MTDRAVEQVFMDFPPLTGTTHAVVHDPWDAADLKRAYREHRPLGRRRKDINLVTSTGTEAVDDAFQVLHKADPHLVGLDQMAPGHMLNWVVINELLGLPVTRRLREYTVGDLWQSATATVEIATKLEAIFDRLSVASGYVDKLIVTLSGLEKARAEVRDAEEVLADLDGDDLVETQRAALRRANAQEAASLFESVAAELKALVEQELAGQMGDVSADLAGTVASVAARAAELGQACEAWGVAPGELSRLPAADRMKLAKSLNTPRMRSIAELFGRIQNLSLSAVAEDLPDVHDDVVDLEAGSDLSRVAPSELLRLAEPLTELDFLARLADGQLLQHEVRGSDEAGRGGIVMCIDGSGSMGIGDRDLWAKATMLVLLHLARSQGRSMHVIHFGFRRLTHFPFVSAEDFTPDRIIAAAQAFWASGTDFEAPMATALEVLKGEYEANGRTQADVVFATDDECAVDPVFMEEYLASMRALGARTWGLMVGSVLRPGGALHQMSEGRVLTVQDLTSGRDIRSLLAGVR